MDATVEDETHGGGDVVLCVIRRHGLWLGRIGGISEEGGGAGHGGRGRGGGRTGGDGAKQGRQRQVMLRPPPGSKSPLPHLSRHTRHQREYVHVE